MPSVGWTDGKGGQDERDEKDGQDLDECGRESADRGGVVWKGGFHDSLNIFRLPFVDPVAILRPSPPWSGCLSRRRSLSRGFCRPLCRET